MPTMSGPEQLFCRSTPWKAWTRKVVLPWATNDAALRDEVLEVGCGGGSMAAGIVNTHPDVRLTLTDIDPRMVQATASALGERPGVQVQQGDVTDLPFKDDSFDFVLTFLMLHHVVNWTSALIEIRRVLRPGGRLIGYDLTATAAARVIHWADRSPHRLIESTELSAGLKQSGFERVSVEASWAGHVMRFQAD